MNVRSAKFIKGVVGEDEVLQDGTPQVAFIGRSNVGKSSIINCLTNQKNLARTSSFPGRTQEINVFLINKSVYLLDLPGYGFVQSSAKSKYRLQDLIYWYFFKSGYNQKKVVLIIDANIGPTQNDLDMLASLDQQMKPVVVAANKIDKINKSQYKNQLNKIQIQVGNHKIIPCSTVEKIGIGELGNELLA